MTFDTPSSIELELSNLTLKPSNCLFFMSLFIICNFADMKKTNRYFLFFLFNMSCLLANAQVRLMTIDEVDSLVSRCNLQPSTNRTLAMASSP